MPDTAHDLLRHALATLAYRSGKVLRADPSIGPFDAGAGVRTPAEILAHMGDLIDWAQSTVEEREAWVESAERDWDTLVARFFAALAHLDATLADRPLDDQVVRRLLQGPVADALTHTGQLALLRRLSGAPVKGENYARADIVTGRVGREQAAPRREF